MQDESGAHVLSLTRLIAAPRAEVAHWSAEDKAQHEAMGFHQGWGGATDQLAELAAAL